MSLESIFLVQFINPVQNIYKCIFVNIFLIIFIYLYLYLFDLFINICFVNYFVVLYLLPIKISTNSVLSHSVYFAVNSKRNVSMLISACFSCTVVCILSLSRPFMTYPHIGACCYSDSKTLWLDLGWSVGQ